MSDENKELNTTEGVDDEVVDEAVNPVEEEAENNTADNWQWDAAVPETQTDNITIDELVIQAEALDNEEVTETAEDEATEENVEAEETTEENDDDDGLCIVCGKPRKASPSDLYCEECRKKFLRTDYGVGHIIFAFVMVIVVALSYFIFASTVAIASKVNSAQELLADARYSDAMTACEEAASEASTINTGINSVLSAINQNFASKDWFDSGKKLDMIYLEAYVKTISISDSGHDSFVSAVESVFVNSDDEFDYALLEKSGYDEIKNAYDFCSQLSEAGTEFTSGLQDFVSYNDDSSIAMDYDKAMEYVDGLDAQTPAQKCMTDYCRFIVAYYANKGNDEIFKYFDSICEEAGEFDYLFWQTYMEAAYQNEAYDTALEISSKVIERNPSDTNAYYYQVESLIYTEDLDGADKACEKLKESNPEGLDYYSLKANVLRRQGKFEDAVELCKEGIAAGEDAEIYRQQAIAYMLLDNKESALEAMKQSYDIELTNAYSGESSNYLVETLNTAALITCICDDETTYDEIIDIFESEGVSLNESVQKCIKGEITFEDIFMKGTGEV